MHVKVPMRVARIEGVVEAAVRPVAPQQQELAGAVLGEECQADGKVLGQVLAAPHEGPEFESAVTGSKPHIVAKVPAIQLHFTLRRFRDRLGTANEAIDFVLRSEERRVGKECRSRWSASPSN